MNTLCILSILWIGGILLVVLIRAIVAWFNDEPAPESSVIIGIIFLFVGTGIAVVQILICFVGIK